MRRDNLNDSEITQILRRLEALESAAPVGSTSITRGRLRVASAEGLLVEGSAVVSGELDVTGLAVVDGELHITGTLNVDGPTDISDTLNVHGATTIGGATTISGPTTLGATLTVNSSGKIVAGNITIDALGTTSGRIISGQLYLRGTSGGVYVDSGLVVMGNVGVTGNINATGTITGSSKTFKIPHPILEDTWLWHGSTESPAHGVEYWGDVTLGDDGSAVVELPPYFEALTIEEDRSVLVTGRGFCADWSDIEDGSFTVTGRPSGRFSWLVKAVRADITLDVEVPMTEEELLLR